MTSKAKITLSLDDLHTPQVEEKLRQQAALSTAQENSRRASTTPSRLPVPDPANVSIWRNTFFNLTVFGLLGGLLAWGCGELVQNFSPNLHKAAEELERQELIIHNENQEGRLNNVRAQADLRLLDRAGQHNPWFRVDTDLSLTDTERAKMRVQLQERDMVSEALGEIGFYCACGVMIALALGMAESVASRNLQSAAIYGGIGAVLGLVGGVVVFFVATWLYHRIGGGVDPKKTSLGYQIFARAVAWGILGLFLSAAPGVVMRNWRKLCLGLIGGLVGGIIGGALFDPIAKYSDSGMLSRLIAIVSIGVITGIGTALVENVAKQGWLKVIQGLIAGKQFIIYRNPTFIGSSPHCEIYLFKDFKVGPRHAALHILPGGYDIEDLGTGSKTIINGRPVRRARLRNGDQIRIGSTAFTFQERPRKT
jgi:hypothetical protein